MGDPRRGKGRIYDICISNNPDGIVGGPHHEFMAIDPTVHDSIDVSLLLPSLRVLIIYHSSRSRIVISEAFTSKDDLDNYNLLVILVAMKQASEAPSRHQGSQISAFKCHLF